MVDLNIEYIELTADKLNEIKNITPYKYNDCIFLLNQLKKYENMPELFYAYYCIYYLFTTKKDKNNSKIKEFISNNDENYKVIFINMGIWREDRLPFPCRALRIYRYE